jgi:hypothetical protein
MFTGDTFSSEMFSDEAIQFLEKYQSEDPFLMYISYTAPHDPRMAPQEFASMYDPEKIKLPANFMPQHPFDNGEMWIRDENLAGFPRSEEVVKEHIAAYYAMITHLDYHIGRVLDVLQKSGKADNTIIVFAGDNGLAVGQHGLLGKQNLYEHSIRVPLIFCGPDIAKNTRSTSLCYLQDIFPTLCELLGIQIPDSVEGKSLVPAIKDQNVKIRDSLFLAYTKIHRAVRRDDNWKLIKYNVKGVETTQLFNLNDDPWEIKNLTEDSRYKSQLEQLTNLLKSYMKKLNDFCDLDKLNWGLPEEKDGITKVQNSAKNKPVRFLNTSKPRYSKFGINSLVDGIRASSDFKDGYWIGLEAEDLDAVIDLGTISPINKVSIGFLEDQTAWIFYPIKLEILVSNDGKKYSTQKILQHQSEKNKQNKDIKDFSAKLENITARYLRLKATNMGRCPKWHPGAGQKAWMFVDEIIIR